MVLRYDVCDRDRRICIRRMCVENESDVIDVTKIATKILQKLRIYFITILINTINRYTISY